MVFISIEDFYEKAKSCRVLTRQEEKDCAEKMKNGDPEARQQLIQSYMPMVAARMKRTADDQSLTLALFYMQALEKAVDSFNFLQDREPFSNRFNWAMRQALTRYIVRQ